jgi:hypothetical protein
VHPLTHSLIHTHARTHARTKATVWACARNSHCSFAIAFISLTAAIKLQLPFYLHPTSLDAVCHNLTSLDFVVCVYVCVCVCVLSNWVHAAICEGADLPALKCSSHWSLGLYLASVQLDFVVHHAFTCCTVAGCRAIHPPSTSR